MYVHGIHCTFILLEVVDAKTIRETTLARKYGTIWLDKTLKLKGIYANELHSIYSLSYLYVFSAISNSYYSHIKAISVAQRNAVQS